MGGKSAPPAPDYSPIANAQMEMSKEQAQVAREQLAWAKETWAADREFSSNIFDITKPIMMAQAATAMANSENQQKIIDIQAKSAQNEYDAAVDNRERYKNTFQPIEDQLVSDAASYDSPQKIAELRGRAIGDVNDQFDQARKSAAQRLESYGIDPGQTRQGALDIGVRTAQASQQAAAGEGARLNAENTGRALRGEAINIGKGYPGQIAQAYATSTGAGQNAFNNVAGTAKSAMAGGNDLVTQRLATSSLGNQLMGNPTNWMSGASTSLANSANTLHMGFQDQLASWKATDDASSAGWGGAGKLLGMGMGLFLKEGGKVGHNPAGAIPLDPQDPQGRRDRFGVALSGGEYIVPKSAVDRLGTKHLDQLVAKHGDETDRQAAMSRLQTGKPGGTTKKPDPQAGAIPLAI
jgi:hypothetical protein